MAQPSREEYDTALGRKVYLLDFIQRERKRREELFDALALSQQCIRSYETSLDEAMDIIFKYEEYEKIKMEMQNG